MKKPDDYILFKFKNEYAERNEDNAQLFDMLDFLGGTTPDEMPEFDIEIMRIFHDIYAEGEFHESFVSVSSNYNDSEITGEFKSLEEAQVKLTIKGFELKDVTDEYKKPEGHEYLGRSVMKAYKLSRFK